MSNVPRTRPEETLVIQGRPILTRPFSVELKDGRILQAAGATFTTPLMMEASPGLIHFRIPTPMEIKSVGAVPL